MLPDNDSEKNLDADSLTELLVDADSEATLDADLDTDVIVE